MQTVIKRSHDLAGNPLLTLRSNGYHSISISEQIPLFEAPVQAYLQVLVVAVNQLLDVALLEVVRQQ